MRDLRRSLTLVYFFIRLGVCPSNFDARQWARDGSLLGGTTDYSYYYRDEDKDSSTRDSINLKDAKIFTDPSYGRYFTMVVARRVAERIT